MASLVLDNVSKKYGNVLGVDGISVEVKDGEFVALIGPSGCGKSSTMRMIAGLESITTGSIFIDGARVNDLRPAVRQTAMSFENYGLYPHMTIFENIAYPLKIRKTPTERLEAEVVRIARLLHIEELLDSKPKEVSGGVQQRVSLARALVRKPSVFLLDEPLSHLDADLRSLMRGELKRLQKMGGSTMIYVTHDQLEAMTMSDRIIVMNEGRFQQVGTPTDIFYRPANRFVAWFIGEPAMNLFPGRVQRMQNEVQVWVQGRPFTNIPKPLAERLLESTRESDGQVEVGVRPPDIELRPPGELGMPVKVRIREFLGEDVLLTLDAQGQKVRMIGPRHLAPLEGDSAVAVPRADRVHFFSISTHEAIGHTGAGAEA
ncbi:MAG: sn-glycerol 3-phosphate transport system ATP-binding protein [Acidobacteriaceae bacterium]|nr:sn-glycerol 3-phosphate transport system ATP-binding protein [Acidobacteriaceae bacterium]MEA3148125.1 sn-glycerol 3-phosphate transport system ATP-binding protein [Verrucomicrobiota bacterium]